ncbi:SMAD/FHA domain [Pseudocohnilembus persalinus]|uniref:SMAD/FHA domain n=1 Tax=Pseudocohnilembus persalinus TaxID=266149 RepID=A0A0V0QCB4_PSEPJ|nr:SMAD/FHA domain [Pseudocohnilembus persalinus]|eukprot:KRW99875.1 SMAD/FHA domain [Pseudocohnilembus persalinus]
MSEDQLSNDIHSEEDYQQAFQSPVVIDRQEEIEFQKNNEQLIYQQNNNEISQQQQLQMFQQQEVQIMGGQQSNFQVQNSVQINNGYMTTAHQRMETQGENEHIQNMQQDYGKDNENEGQQNGAGQMKYASEMNFMQNNQIQNLHFSQQQQQNEISQHINLDNNNNGNNSNNNNNNNNNFNIEGNQNRSGNQQGEDQQISQIFNSQQILQRSNLQNNSNNNNSINNNNNHNNSNNNIVFRSPLPDSLNSKYYNYKKKTSQNNSNFNYDEPYMKITILRNTNTQLNEQPQEYFINANGMKDTKKNTDNNDIIIGRQFSTTNDQQQEIHPNDIVLASNDRAISRIHCKIIYKEGFLKSNIQTDFQVFLGCTHKRSNSIWKKMPCYLMQIVLDFVRPEKKFYLVDIGSVYGTFIRVKPEEPQMVMKGQIYLIGADTQFNVTDMCVPQVLQQGFKKNSNNNYNNNCQSVYGSMFTSSGERENEKKEQQMDIECCSQEQRNLTRGKIEEEEEEEGKHEQFNKIEEDLYQNVEGDILSNNLKELEEEEEKIREEYQDKLFFEFLAEEKNKNKAQIHGLDESEEAILEKFVKKNNNEQNLNRTQHLGENSQRPFIKIELVSQGQTQNNNQPSIHIFVAPIYDEKLNIQKKNFKIGRSQDCNIIITHNTISRKQSCIFYDYIKKQWFLHDGEIIGDIRRESSNGTWISLQDCREKRPQNNRQESDQRQIFNGTEIKISESILKVELFNMEKKKKEIMSD